MRKIAVLGDVMLDHYMIGEVNRISPEAPVPVVKKTQEIISLGGAANVAVNIANLDISVNLYGSIGKDHNGSILKGLLEKHNISSSLLESSEATTTKMRIIGNGQQIVRFDIEKYLNHEIINENYYNLIEKEISDYKLIVISDYNKGFCSNAILQSVISKANTLDIKTLIDPKGPDWTKYKGASFITPNINELSQIVKEQVNNNDEEITNISRHLIDQFNFKSLIVTRGDQGISYITKSQVYHSKGFAIPVFDVTGAGDTVISALSRSILDGIKMETCIDIANELGHISVSKKGVYVISENEYIKARIKFIND